MENESTWQKDSITASDIISDITRAKETLEKQSFFRLNQNTKSKLLGESTEYDSIIVVDEKIPDDLIVSYNPSSYDHTKLIQVSEKQSIKPPEVRPYIGNRKQRREAERKKRRMMKRKKSGG